MASIYHIRRKHGAAAHPYCTKEGRIKLKYSGLKQVYLKLKNKLKLNGFSETNSPISDFLNLFDNFFNYFYVCIVQLFANRVCLVSSYSFQKTVDYMVSFLLGSISQLIIKVTFHLFLSILGTTNYGLITHSNRCYDHHVVST